MFVGCVYVVVGAGECVGGVFAGSKPVGLSAEKLLQLLVFL